MPTHTIVEARGLWLLLLNAMSCAAVTMPWRVVYILQPYLNHEGLLAHERVHIEQIDREGPVKFSVKYLYQLARHGYRGNSFEREAYTRAPL